MLYGKRIVRWYQFLNLKIKLKNDKFDHFIFDAQKSFSIQIQLYFPTSFIYYIYTSEKDILFNFL